MTDDDAMTAALAPPPPDPERHDYGPSGCAAVALRVFVVLLATAVFLVLGAAYVHGGGA